jgi:hypothetical protein
MEENNGEWRDVGASKDRPTQQPCKISRFGSMACAAASNKQPIESESSHLTVFGLSMPRVVGDFS